MTHSHDDDRMATRRLRSRAWFDDPANADMTALYLERYMNFGLSLEELQSGKPIIGIAQTGSDLSRAIAIISSLPSESAKACARQAESCFEFPVHPIQETGKRPTAGLDRNLAYLGLVEVLFGYPLDGVVLTIGCDKTTPACLMAAATVNMPAIALSVGPMLNGWYNGRAHGLGNDRVEGARAARGWRDRLSGLHQARRVVGAFDRLLQHDGHCDDDELAGRGARACRCRARRPFRRRYRDRQEAAYRTGQQIVEMVAADRKPSDILTREAFINAIRVNSAIGGSTNAPIHLNALARHIGVELDARRLAGVRPATFRCS